MEGNLHCVKIYFFTNLQKFRSVEFFKSIVHFPLQVPKAITKKQNRGLIFLIISATS